VSEREPEEKTCYDMLSGSRPGNRCVNETLLQLLLSFTVPVENVPFEPELTSARC
jgi:hypothetical protein